MKQAQHGGSNVLQARFRRDGFLAPVRIMDAAEAATHRERLEKAEAVFGDLHYEAKVYTILRSPLELATHPRVLETVTALIGPNVLFNAQYIATHMRQTQHSRDTALLVHGVDTFHHFDADIPASADLQPEALVRQRELDGQVRATMGEQQRHGETFPGDRRPCP